MSFAPTHRVIAETPTWPSPDRSQSPGPPLYANLEVQVLEQQGDLSRVLCDNGWEAWTNSASLTPLGAAPPTAPPPPPIPDPAPIAASAPRTRPAWLVPAVLAAVVVIGIGAFALRGGDDDTTTTSAGANATVVRTPKDTTPFSDASFPSEDDMEAIFPPYWQRYDVCVGGPTGDLRGEDADDTEDCNDRVYEFDHVCDKELLEGPRPTQRGELRFSTDDPHLDFDVQLRLYPTDAEAERALEAADAIYTGPCGDPEETDTAFTPLALGDDLGDQSISYEAVDIYHEVWVRLDRLVIYLSLSYDPDAPTASFYEDVIEEIDERTAALRS